MEKSGINESLPKTQMFGSKQYSYHLDTTWAWRKTAKALLEINISSITEASSSEVLSYKIVHIWVLAYKIVSPEKVRWPVQFSTV